MHTTEGSAALELTKDSPLALFSKVECYKLATGVYDPLLSERKRGNNLGNKGINFLRIYVHQSVLQRGNKEIKFIAYAKKEMQIDIEVRSVQLLLFSYKCKAALVEKTGAFGSTGKHMFWKTVLNDQRPKLMVQMNGVDIEVLVDTGSDINMLSQLSWNPDYPL